MPVLDFRHTPLYTDTLARVADDLASQCRPAHEGETFSTETAPSQSPELDSLLGALARATLEGLTALGVSDALERPFEVTHLWVEGYAAGTVRPPSGREAAALVGTLVLEGTGALELHNPQEAQRQRLFGKAAPSPMPLPASPHQYFLIPGWLEVGSQPFESRTLLVFWSVAEVADTRPRSRPLSLWSLTQVAPSAALSHPLEAVSLRFRPAVGASWLCRTHTVVEATDPETGEKHRRENQMTSREEIVASQADGLVKKVEVLECSEPQQEDNFQGSIQQVLCSPRGVQTLILEQAHAFPAGPPLFPEGPVRPGDTWPVKLDSDCTLPGSSSNLEAKQTLRGTGRFDSLEQGLARLHIQTTTELISTGVVSKGRQNLNLLVEVDTGVCRQSDIETHQEIPLPSGPPLVVVTTARIELTPEAIGVPALAADRCCSGCGQSVPEDSRFCHNCGKPMVSLRCPQCQAPVAEGVHYCPACGQALGSVAASPD